jgi:hypothetical protein
MIEIEDILVSLKNNLDVSRDLGDLLTGCLLDILLNFLR